MPKGFDIPMKQNSSGGIATVEGDVNDIKIIKIALADGDNDNAFQQDITLGEGMIFDLNDPNTRSRISRKIREIFEQFKTDNRFKLLEDTIEWSEDSSTQEMILNFKYLNLESDEPKEFEERF